jgi:nucleoside phosphorylase
MRIGIVTALTAEARTLPAARGRFLLAHDYEVRCAGPGAARAAEAAAACLAARCEAVLSWGVAGGLSVAARPGDLFVAATAIGEDGRRHTSDDGLAGSIATSLGARIVRSGAIYSSSEPLCDASAKTRAQADCGAALVDLESASIAATCVAHGAHFAAIRAVVDPADFSLPSAALLGLHADGRTRALPVLRRLLGRPQEITPLLRLAWWHSRALRALAAAAARLCQ